MEGEVGQASHSHCSPASPLSVMILFPHSSPGFLAMVMGKLAAGSGMFHPDKLTSLHVDEEMSFQEASHLLEASQLLGSRVGVRPRRAGFRALPFSSLAVGAQRLQDGSTLEDVERDHLAISGEGTAAPEVKRARPSLLDPATGTQDTTW